MVRILCEPCSQLQYGGISLLQRGIVFGAYSR